jgi:hypothetical protein
VEAQSDTNYDGEYSQKKNCLFFSGNTIWETQIPKNYTYGCLMVRIQFDNTVACSVTF